MRTLLRSGALIDSWFDMLTDEQRPVARTLHATVIAAVPALRAAVRWGNVVYQYEGANALALVPHKNHVNLQLFKGAAVAARYPQLEGSGKGVRHLKLRQTEAVVPDLISCIVRAAVEALEVVHPD